MDRPAEFAGIIQKSLESHTPRLKEILKKVISCNYDPAVKFIQFEVFPDEFTDGFPAMVFFFDANWNEYFVNAKGKPRKPCDIEGHLLSIDHVYTQELEDQYADDVGDPWSIAVDVFTKWFARCWKEEDGINCKAQAFIAPHDSFFLLDLNKNITVKQTDIRSTS